GGPAEAADDVHQRRLARPRLAHNGHELAGADLQRDVIEGPDLGGAVTVALADAVERQQGRRRLRFELRHRRSPKMPGRRWPPPARPPPLPCPGVPTMTWSPAARPDRTWADVRSLRPIFTVRRRGPSLVRTRTSYSSVLPARGWPSAATGTSGTPFASPRTKNTCAVMLVISTWSSFLTSMSTL